MFQTDLEIASTRFSNSHARTRAILWHYIDPAQHLAELEQAARKYDTKAADEYMWKREHFIMTLEVHRFRFHEVLLCHAVDNFQIFLTELLRLVFRKKPETLKAGNADMKLSVAEVLDAENVKELVAEKKVALIDGKGFSGFLAFLETLKVEAPLQPDDAERIQGIIDLRSLLTHKGGVIDDEYLRRSKRADLTRGSQMDVSRDMVLKAIEWIEYAALQIANTVGDKFGLTTNPRGHIRHLRRPGTYGGDMPLTRPTP